MAAKENSFDIVSQVDLQEVMNAVNQTRKELSQRFDFKNSKTELKLEEAEITILTEDDFHLRSIVDTLETRLLARKVPIKNLQFGTVEDAARGMVRQQVTIAQGIDADRARAIVKDIKQSKLKVQSSIQGDQVRVAGKNKDDLQAVMALLRENDYGTELQFRNYR